MKFYGAESVKPESLGTIYTLKDKDGEPAKIITLRAMKGLIWGFYSPSPWTVWLRVATLPYGVEITRFKHLAWWKRYSVHWHNKCPALLRRNNR